MRFENRNYAFTRIFVEELSRCGLKHVCICPGSRSTPLTIAFAEHPSIQCWVHLDERSGGYFALGMAKALKEPVALVCTSGTAAANFLPAAVEAFHSNVPLMILTGDRPPELWGWGANQTINQIDIYGEHVKESIVMPHPEVTLELLSFVRAQSCKAFATAVSVPAGPVHINFPLREPLEPLRVDSDFPENIEDSLDEAWTGRKGSNPYLSLSFIRNYPNESDIDKLARELETTQEGIIVCGPQTDEHAAMNITKIAAQLNYPVLADPLSQLRSQYGAGSLIVDCYDIFLRDPAITKPLKPKLVLRFGGFPTSKALGQFLEKCSDAEHILVDGNNQWNDPIHVGSKVFHVSPSDFCETLRNKTETRLTEWYDDWNTITNKTRIGIQEVLSDCKEMFEGKLFAELGKLLPSPSNLFIGNSMPVRDLDTFFPTSDKNLRIFGNRGASGIDGIVSSALGVASITGKLVVVLGDLSFYHDLNGLLAAKSHKIDATIIVINNDGGGIFSFLPQVGSEGVFEKYFGTPHGLNFQAAAELYHLGYQQTETWESFRSAFTANFQNEDTNIIEIPGNRESNLNLHRELINQVLSQIR